MTIDELIQKIDGQPKASQETAPEAKAVVETTQTADKEADMLPIGQQFEEYCESKKRK